MRDYKQTVRELRDPHFVYHFSRDYLKNMMDDAADTIEELCELVDNNKTAVKHGQWIENEGRSGWHCSCCGKDDLYAYLYAENNELKLQDFYCPNCGAKMNGKVE